MTKTLGVTGGIGSGKSAARRILADCGARIFDADRVARDLMRHSEEVRAEVQATFGPESYAPDGALNRAWLAGRVFGDEGLLSRLNAIVHPRVRLAFVEAFGQATKARAPLLVHEAALIFESGLDGLLDAVVVIDAPVEVRLERVMRRDGADKEQVLARMRHQLPASELRRRADIVIDNNGSLGELRQKIEHLYRDFLSQ